MNKWLKVGVILIVLAFLFVPTIIAMKYLTILQIYSHFVDSIYNLTGLNKYLVKAVVVLLMIPLIIGIKFVLSPFNKKRKYIGIAILVTLISLYNLSLYHFTKDLYFAFSEGKVLKWYALTPDGVKFFDKAGVEPVYGIPLKPVTPDVIRNLKLLQKGDFRPVDPTNVQFFNPITGEPQVWYYQYPDGTHEFYDKPGYHPITGDPLKPVTKQIYFEWREKAKTKPPSVNYQEEMGKQNKQSNQQIAMAKKPEIDEKERKLNELKALINRGVTSQMDKSNVAMVIEARKTESGFSPENTLYGLLIKEGVNIITNLFKEESFKAKGFFREIYDGDTELLKQADALSKIDYLILGKLNYSFQKGGIERGLVSCNINFSYKVINRNAEVVKVDNINVIGPGFSEDTALQRGLEILAEKYRERILNIK
ncbi:MAG: hypothetical protein QXY90_06870 [Candidatus Anstonellales archaeon]